MEHLRDSIIEANKGFGQDELLLTLKNYHTKKGISSKLFKYIENRSLDQTLAKPLKLQVEGPFGKGLHINQPGVHIAFTAGTGVLVFLDFVAYLISFNGSKLKSSELKVLEDPRFKFVLFVSFPSE